MEDIKYIPWTEAIVDAIRTKIAFVKYVKKDGSIREIHCTTNPSSIPEDKIPTGKKITRKENVFRVFDVDKNDWRSINTDKVIAWGF